MPGHSKSLIFSARLKSSTQLFSKRAETKLGVGLVLGGSVVAAVKTQGLYRFTKQTGILDLLKKSDFLNQTLIEGRSTDELGTTFSWISAFLIAGIMFVSSIILFRKNFREDMPYFGPLALSKEWEFFLVPIFDRYLELEERCKEIQKQVETRQIQRAAMGEKDSMDLETHDTYISQRTIFIENSVSQQFALRSNLQVMIDHWKDSGLPPAAEDQRERRALQKTDRVIDALLRFRFPD